MSKSLGFIERGLALLQIAVQNLAFFLCALALCDVLARTEHLVGSPRCISSQIAAAVDDAYLTAGTNEAVFRFDVYPVTNRSLCVLEHVPSVFRVDQFSNCL